jgi:predicted nucleic acid-binding protein
LSEPDAPPPLVLDTSVAVKFYVPEEGYDEHLRALARESGVDLER